MSHYDLLGIAGNATQDEIKRSYFRLIRKHSPESDPEKFKLLRTAFEVLSDPKARHNYDAMEQHGERVRELFHHASEAMEEENYQRAESLLKELIVLNPEADGAKNMLGLVYYHSNKTDQAISLFEKLSSEHSDQHTFLMNLGHAHAQKAEHINNSDEHAYFMARKLCFEKARKAYGRASILQKFNSEPYLAIARTYAQEENFSSAIKEARKAVEADEKVDFQDFDAFLFICLMHMLQKDHRSFDNVVKEIKAIPTEDPEMTSYIASRFAQVGVWRMQASEFPDANLFLRASLQFVENREVREIADNALLATNALEQLSLSGNDNFIIQPIKALVAIRVLVFVGEDVDNREQIIRNSLYSLGNYHVDDILNSIDRIKHHYSAIYNVANQLLDQLRDDILTQTGVDNTATNNGKERTTQSSSQAENSGCAIILLIACGGVLAIPFFLLCVKGLALAVI
jgi:curved DNA-binding protein CbpA